MPKILNQNSINKFTGTRLNADELSIIRSHFLKRLGEQVKEAEYRAIYSGRSTIMGRDVKLASEPIVGEKTRLSGAGCRRIVKEFAHKMHVSKEAYTNIQTLVEQELQDWMKRVDSSPGEKAVAISMCAPHKSPSLDCEPDCISLKPVYRGLVVKAGIQLQTSKDAKQLMEQIVGSICTLLTTECNTDTKTISFKDIELATNIWLIPTDAHVAIASAKAALIRYGNTKDTTRSRRANVLIAVSSVENIIRKVAPGKNISEQTPVYLAAVLESILVKLIKAGSMVAVSHSKRTITTAHIRTAIKNTPELKRLYNES